MRRRDETAHAAAESFAERARDDIDPIAHARQRGGATAFLAEVPVAWQSSTSTMAPWRSASAQISGSFAT